MDFESQIFAEPELEFGDRHHHPDPRLGLFEAGPLQPFVGEVIKIAVVGSANTVEDTRKFRCAVTAGFTGLGDKHPNLHPAFPGLTNQNPYRCKFEIAEGAPPPFRRAKSTRLLRNPTTRKP